MIKNNRKMPKRYMKTQSRFTQSRVTLRVIYWLTFSIQAFKKNKKIKINHNGKSDLNK